jgi:hypothetical protein
VEEGDIQFVDIQARPEGFQASQDYFFPGSVKMDEDGKIVPKERQSEYDN